MHSIWYSQICALVVRAAIKQYKTKAENETRGVNKKVNTSARSRDSVLTYTGKCKE
uniref:Uncharacterized protein n=1 Tax=Dromaius novaehollandiae TaxID=8790 RepID=A0A8C4PCE9_DRONO